MSAKAPIQSTAGAVPIRTEKGFTMEKVKVTRYIAGKKPEYAARAALDFSSSSDESDRGGNADDAQRRQKSSAAASRGFRRPTAALKTSARGGFGPGVGDDFDDDVKDIDVGSRHRRGDDGARRARYAALSASTTTSSGDARIRRLMKSGGGGAAEGGAMGSEEEQEDDEHPRRIKRGNEESARRRVESSDDAEEDEVSDDELENRRNLLRIRNATREKEELLGKAEESGDEDDVEDEESEYEESESDEDDLHRLKPVFVKKKDRVTLTDNEKEQQKQREQELRKKFETEERKRQSTKLVEDLVKLEVEMERKKQENDHADLTSVVTDDENEELAYETWKVRELKRVKRAKEEKEQHEKEKAEIDKIHSMTEDERRAFLRANPKVVTNKQTKGKYKFLQKYYHRGVFYLDDDDEVYKRNFAEATLDDHFDKTVLPKIMQVKDFGKAGRTKWSHLVAEDTTDFQSAWHADTAQNIKFFQKHGGGVKDVFDRPAMKKRKRN